MFVENQLLRHIKILRIDNGEEYTSHNFIKFCEEYGIQQHLTIPYTPSQNGIVECKMQILAKSTWSKLKSVWSMLKSAQISKIFWTHAIATTCYLRNRSLTSNSQHKTPFQAWYGQKSNLNHCKIFGCLAYAHIPNEKHTKLDYKTIKCIFMVIVNRKA